MDAFWLGGLEIIIEARLPVPSRSSSGQHVSITLAWASSGKAVLVEGWGSSPHCSTCCHLGEPFPCSLGLLICEMDTVVSAWACIGVL